MWAMRIFGSVGVGMMHSMKNCICSGRKVGATLPHPSEKVKELFPIFVHDEHLVCSIAVKEKALAKQREIPMKQKEDNYNHLRKLLIICANIRLG